MQAAPRIYLWPDRFLYLGPSFDTDCHRHHAAQVLVGLEGAFRLRGDSGADWQPMHAAWLDTEIPHQVDASGAEMAVLYVEPESVAYSAFRGGQDHRSTVETATQPYQYQVSALLRDALIECRARGSVVSHAWRLTMDLLQLAPKVSASSVLDPRVEAAIKHMRTSYDGLDNLARRAHLSPGRLSHLFRSQLGVPIRRFALWARLRRAVESAMLGASLTDAAHAAGFADSAHLSNSFRQMFGLPPSFLFDRRLPPEVHFGSVTDERLDPK